MSISNIDPDTALKGPISDAHHPFHCLQETPVSR
jgi:hypothetical protein